MTRLATVLEVESMSTPGRSYRVWVDANGPIFCDCPAHKYPRNGVRSPCKHMRAVSGFSTSLARTAEAAKQAGFSMADLSQTMDVVARAYGKYREGPAPTKRSTNPRIRLLEMQEETTEGSWVTVGDLSRFNNLEVM